MSKEEKVGEIFFWYCNKRGHVVFNPIVELRFFEGKLNLELASLSYERNGEYQTFL